MDYKLHYIASEIEETCDNITCDGCGNDSFTLTYGKWELFGTCTICGSKQSVYSG